MHEKPQVLKMYKDFFYFKLFTILQFPSKILCWRRKAIPLFGVLEDPTFALIRVNLNTAVDTAYTPAV